MDPSPRRHNLVDCKSHYYVDISDLNTLDRAWQHTNTAYIYTKYLVEITTQHDIHTYPDLSYTMCNVSAQRTTCEWICNASKMRTNEENKWTQDVDSFNTWTVFHKVFVRINVFILWLGEYSENSTNRDIHVLFVCSCIFTYYVCGW